MLKLLDELPSHFGSLHCRLSLVKQSRWSVGRSMLQTFKKLQIYFMHNMEVCLVSLLLAGKKQHTSNVTTLSLAGH